MRNKEAKVRELWLLQLKLNKYVGETETELDPSVKEALKNIKKIPDWFNSGIVFSPLVSAMDNDIQALESDIVDMQSTLKELFLEKQKISKDLEKQKEEKILTMHNQIDQINIELQEIRKKQQISNPIDLIENQHEMYFDIESNRCKEEISFLQRENQDLVDTIQAYMEEIELSTNQIVAACDDHKKNVILAKKYKQQIKGMAFEKQMAQKSSAILEKRKSNLQIAVEKLLSMKQDNDQILSELIKEQENDKQMLSTYQNIQNAIRTSQNKQEEALTEMIKAVELAENASAEYHSYQSDVDTYSGEKKRLDDLINDTENNLNEMVIQFEKKAQNFYDVIISKQIDFRMESLKAEQVKLMREKDVVDHQIEIAKQKCSSMSPNIISPDFTSSNSAGYIMKLKDELDSIYQQKETLIRKNSLLKAKIAKNKEKLLSSGYLKRKTITKLRHRRQKNEVDICLLRGNLKSLLQKNGVVAEDNEKVRCYIGQIRKTTMCSLAQELAEKEEIISDIQNKIEVAMNNHQTEIQEIEKEISKYQLLAEQYTNEKQQHEQIHKKQNIESENIFLNSRQQLKSLKNTIKSNYSEIMKGQNILKDTQSQIDYLRDQAQSLLKKERRQKSQIERTKLEQVALITDIERYQDIEQKLDKKIENQKMNLHKFDIPKQIQYSASESDNL